jgi:hypothetical protein
LPPGRSAVRSPSAPASAEVWADCSIRSSVMARRAFLVPQGEALTLPRGASVRPRVVAATSVVGCGSSQCARTHVQVRPLAADLDRTDTPGAADPMGRNGRSPAAASLPE